jgi:hypothetical protein
VTAVQGIQLCPDVNVIGNKFSSFALHSIQSEQYLHLYLLQTFYLGLLKNRMTKIRNKAGKQLSSKGGRPKKSLYVELQSPGEMKSPAATAKCKFADNFLNS